MSSKAFSMLEGGLAELRPSKPPMALSPLACGGSVTSAGWSGMWRLDQHGWRTVTSAPPVTAVIDATSQRGTVQKPLPSEKTSSTSAGLRQDAAAESVVKYPVDVCTQAPGGDALTRGSRCPSTNKRRLAVPAGTGADHRSPEPATGVQPATGIPPDSTGWAPGAAW